ncbi:hypothetical protein AB0B51_35385 [Streptomyces griseus]|uniref:hypothetical protein n=1 Tax=Streptomyces griseus TaxID=1911 RepID=UPI0033DD0BBF
MTTKVEVISESGPSFQSRMLTPVVTGDEVGRQPASTVYSKLRWAESTDPPPVQV